MKRKKRSKEIILIVGGCRSGKSRHALEIAEKQSGKRNVFLATCVPHDREMEHRVARHRAERSSLWTTVETPIHLAEAVKAHGAEADVVLVDCLTLWVTNVLLEGSPDDDFEMEIQKLTLALEAVQCPVVLVGNEVGAGIVPENPLARQFRDLCGFTNQRVAECADRVIWTVAGIPVTVKGD